MTSCLRKLVRVCLAVISLTAFSQRIFRQSNCDVKSFTWKYQTVLHFICSCSYLFTFLPSSQFYWRIRLKSTAYFFDPPCTRWKHLKTGRTDSQLSETSRRTNYDFEGGRKKFASEVNFGTAVLTGREHDPQHTFSMSVKVKTLSDLQLYSWIQCNHQYYQTGFTLSYSHLLFLSLCTGLRTSATRRAAWRGGRRQWRSPARRGNTVGLTSILDRGQMVDLWVRSELVRRRHYRRNVEWTGADSLSVCLSVCLSATPTPPLSDADSVAGADGCLRGTAVTSPTRESK